MFDASPFEPQLDKNLIDRYSHLDGRELLDAMILQALPGRIALVSSFGAEAGVLLAMVAETNPDLPVIFLETGKHFEETLEYVETLSRHLGLTDVRLVTPDNSHLNDHDPDGTLAVEAPDACCHLRKVLPLEKALEGFDAWITGRKKFQNDDRQSLEPVEFEDGRYKINPLLNWTLEDIRAEFDRRGLPKHPLVAQGYPSIGCAPCTSKVTEGADYRDGRWAGQEKTECGIHKAKWFKEDAAEVIAA